MSSPAELPVIPPPRTASIRVHLPTLPEALASLLRTIVIALFLLTFVLQPLLIPSESMERTLLVGDFLLFNKQVYAPSSSLSRWLMPYRPVERGDIIVFHHPKPPLLVKRVIGLPGDHLRIDDGRVIVNGVPLDEPYAAFEPAPPNDFRDNFPAKVYTDPQVDPDWWRQMQSLTRNGELVVPRGEYFVLGDNRNHSSDSRYWGFVPLQAIVARPLVIYFSLTRPSSTDVQQAADDRLGHERELAVRLAGFARWRRIFQVVH
ncbi:MAG TPA: signal peptidase I [Terracidiphilus sp.]|jgi:signal peptidase I|nr:signal peptidase I [Terracidiphilus sp.]